MLVRLMAGTNVRVPSAVRPPLVHLLPCISTNWHSSILWTSRVPLSSLLTAQVQSAPICPNSVTLSQNGSMPTTLTFSQPCTTHLKYSNPSNCTMWWGAIQLTPLILANSCFLSNCMFSAIVWPLTNYSIKMSTKGNVLSPVLLAHNIN